MSNIDEVLSKVISKTKDAKDAQRPQRNFYLLSAFCVLRGFFVFVVIPASSTFKTALFLYSTFILIPSLCDENSGAYMHCILVMPLLKLPVCVTNSGYSNT